MFKSKLRALNYHESDKFQLTNDNISTPQFRQLISWIEDQKIRHYKIEQRDALRDLNSDNWHNSYEQYLKDLGCPFNSQMNELVLDWLLNLSVRLEYEDNYDNYQHVTSDNVKKAKLEPKVVQKNPLDNLDFNSVEFKEGVISLAQMLKVAQHPDHLVTLKAIATMINNILSPDVIAVKTKPENVSTSASALDKIEKSPLGFDTQDKVLNHAAKILRLLYIKDLRELQTRLNEIVVAAQAVTANPKTNTALGQVGK